MVRPGSVLNISFGLYTSETGSTGTRVLSESRAQVYRRAGRYQ